MGLDVEGLVLVTKCYAISPFVGGLSAVSYFDHVIVTNDAILAMELLELWLFCQISVALNDVSPRQSLEDLGTSALSSETLAQIKVKVGIDGKVEQEE